MKTTIQVSDALYQEARRVAASEGKPVRDLIEEGLRWVLASREQRRPFTLPDASVGGEGLQQGIGWDLPRDLAYEDG